MVQKTIKYTVITGASSGIGYETAKAFADRNKNLIVVARRQKNLEELKTEILKKHPSLNIVIKVADLSNMKNVYKLYSDLQKYSLETWINNAGFGNYEYVARQNIKKIETMLNLNIKAITILSSLFVRDYKNIDRTQLINISSCGGYTIVPTAITYCATKFFISAFTEGLAHELADTNANMQAKILAPAATKTEFGKVANNVDNYDYDKFFGKYHTSKQIAEFLLKLYDSNKVVGIVDRETFKFELCNTLFPYAGNSNHNQKLKIKNK